MWPGASARRWVVWRRIATPRAVTQDVRGVALRWMPIGACWAGSASGSSSRRRVVGLGPRCGAAVRRMIHAAATVRAGTRVWLPVMVGGLVSGGASTRWPQRGRAGVWFGGHGWGLCGGAAWSGWRRIGRGSGCGWRSRVGASGEAGHPPGACGVEREANRQAGPARGTAQEEVGGRGVAHDQEGGEGGGGQSQDEGARAGLGAQGSAFGGEIQALAQGGGDTVDGAGGRRADHRGQDERGGRQAGAWVVVLSRPSVEDFGHRAAVGGRAGDRGQLRAQRGLDRGASFLEGDREGGARS